MTNIEAKKYVVAALDGLQRLTIQSTIDNITYMDGSLHLLGEVRDALDALTIEEPAAK